MNKILPVILAAVLSSYSYADNKNDRYVLQNLNQDFITCGVFYSLSSSGAQKAKDAPKAKLFSEIAMKYYKESFDISKIINMSDEAVEAAAELTMKNMGREMKNDFINYSIIINKYGRFCKNLLEDPDSRLDYWIKKIK
jgi:hypothetical protein|tara:strand:- start:117 stop:533 length:417 start_codon:yes stop_codon:yes gene_type:complete